MELYKRTNKDNTRCNCFKVPMNIVLQGWCIFVGKPRCWHQRWFLRQKANGIYSEDLWTFPENNLFCQTKFMILTWFVHKGNLHN